jgi:uncharacterized protein (DUF1800 family)
MSTATLRLSRRRVLVMAAGGAAAAGGIRYLTMQIPGATAVASSAGSAGAWASPLGNPQALAAHLLRRAGFGYTDTELESAASLSYGDLVDRVVGQAPDPLPTVADPTSYQQVVRAWYAHMATTAAQFPERMTLFWHGLLTSDYRKAARLPFVLQQNQLYRAMGRGDFRSLITAVTYDPLMIRYLDLEQSTAKSPNENYSRELMELFTIGAGNYTEDDVREGARAFSGIRTVLLDKSGKPVPLPARKGMNPQQYYAAIAQLLAQGATFKGRLAARQHDTGTKTFLGHTGNLDPEQAIDVLLAQPACATHIAQKALMYFCAPNPSASLVSDIATQFRNSKYDIKTLMRAIFTSSDFTAAANYRSLVRAPADYMVATMRALSRADLASAAMKSGAEMDQILYDMPTVAGWPANQGWVSSCGWLARLNFASTVVSKQQSFPDPVHAVQTQLDSVVGPDTAVVFNAGQTAADRWYALLSSPEFHLK